jgi:hypothetical protein
MFNLEKNDKIVFNSTHSVDLDNYIKKVIEVRNHWNNRKDLINLHKDKTFSRLLEKIEADIKYLNDSFNNNIYDKKCNMLINEYENTDNPFKYLSYVDDFCIPCKRLFNNIKYNLLLDYLKNFFRKHVNMISNQMNINKNNLTLNYINNIQKNQEIIRKNNRYNKMGIMGEIAAAIMLGLNFNHCFKIRTEIGTQNNPDSGDLNYNGCFIDIKTTDSIYNNLIVDDSKKTINDNRIDVYFLLYFNEFENSFTFLGAIPHETLFSKNETKKINGVEKIYADKSQLMSFKDAYIQAMNFKLNKQLKDENMKLKHNKISSRLKYINDNRIEWKKNIDYSSFNNQQILDNIIISSLSKLYNNNLNVNAKRVNIPQINIFNDPNKDIKGFFVFSNKTNYNKEIIRNVFESKYPGYIKFYNKKQKP